MRQRSAKDGELAEMSPTQVLDETTDVLATIGRNIRQFRSDKGMTLQHLADRTGLSISMLSLLERGKTGPSIGTLVGIASVLGAQMTDLLDQGNLRDDEVVTKLADQQVVESGGVTRRIVKTDRDKKIEIAVNEYEPGTANAPKPVAHEGFEFGVGLSGCLEITINGRSHLLKEGDVISYSSLQPHRIVNSGRKRARAMWINLRSS